MNATLDTDSKFFAVFNNGSEFELWSKPEGCNSKGSAAAQAEMMLLDTYGSRDPKYLKRLNNLTVINKSEAEYLKLLN
jgi:hypothetical protein